ncbi:MAG: hypothetical protein KKC84_00415, partial [Candidatus Omnitrophica bacterium]|nr:hypothetical protein [Candidatus Omnitrophota bacterium]
GTLTPDGEGLHNEMEAALKDVLGAVVRAETSSSPIVSIKKAIVPVINMLSTLGIGYAILHFISIAPSYGGLAAFAFTYLVGFAGMAVAALIAFGIWHFASPLTRGPSIGLEEVIGKIYPDMDSAYEQKLLKNIVRHLSDAFSQDQYQLFKGLPLRILLRIPVIGGALRLLLSNRITGFTVKAIDWFLEAFTMLILYQFFLRHILVPLALAVWGYKISLPGNMAIKVVTQAKVATDRELQRSTSRKTAHQLKDIITLRHFLDFTSHTAFMFGLTIKDNSSIVVKSVSALMAIFFVLTHTLISLARQRLIIATISTFVGSYFLGLLPVSSKGLLLATIVSIPVPFANPLAVTLALIISSAIIIFFLDIPAFWRMWKENQNRFIDKKTAFWHTLGASGSMIANGTLGMMFVGPEIEMALNIFSGVPVLGDTVVFMEEFVYGANGREGIGRMILEGVEGQVEAHTGVYPQRDLFNFVSRHNIFESADYTTNHLLDNSFPLLSKEAKDKAVAKTKKIIALQRAQELDETQEATLRSLSRELYEIILTGKEERLQEMIREMENAPSRNEGTIIQLRAALIELEIERLQMPITAQMNEALAQKDFTRFVSLMEEAVRIRELVEQKRKQIEALLRGLEENTIPADASAEGKTREEVNTQVSQNGGIQGIIADYGTIREEDMVSRYGISEATLSQLANSYHTIFVRGPPEIGTANYFEAGTRYIIIPEDATVENVAHEVYAVLHPEVFHENNPIVTGVPKVVTQEGQGRNILALGSPNGFNPDWDVRWNDIDPTERDFSQYEYLILEARTISGEGDMYVRLQDEKVSATLPASLLTTPIHLTNRTQTICIPLSDFAAINHLDLTRIDRISYHYGREIWYFENEHPIEDGILIEGAYLLRRQADTGISQNGVQTTVFSSLHGVFQNAVDLVANRAMTYEGNVRVVADEHIAQGSWIYAGFSRSGEYFTIHHRTQNAAVSYDIYNPDWSSFVADADTHVLRFLVLGEGNTFSIVLKDSLGHELAYPIGEILANSWHNQAAVVPFDWLLSRAPVGFNWSAVTDFMVRADQPGAMLISDIKVIDRATQAPIAMGVAGHDLQGTGWRHRVGNYIRYFGQPPSVGTYFTTIFEPIRETDDADNHYSDIVERATALEELGVTPAVTLEFRSWAQITQGMNSDETAAAKIDAERERFNRINRDNGGISYDDFIAGYVNENRVLDAVNAGLLDSLLHAIASEMSGLDTIYLRLFHEPYFWFPWGMRARTDIVKFKDAWIHVGEIFEQEGARNVKFVMTLNPYEPGGRDWSEVTAIPSRYLDVVELDGYTDPVLRQNAALSANELFAKKLTEIEWQLNVLYEDAAERPAIALGEFAFTGEASVGRPKELIYEWFINDLIRGAYPLSRFSILNTYRAGPRPAVDALGYSPAQEGYWSAQWQPEEAWYPALLRSLLGDSIPTVISEEERNNEPSDEFSFSLTNYPNPFGLEGTTIRYSVPAGAEAVSLKIYNSVGQVIEERIGLSTHAGEHTLRWEAIDRNGRAAAAGIYIAEISVEKVDGTEKATRKMTVLDGVSLAPASKGHSLKPFLSRVLNGIMALNISFASPAYADTLAAVTEWVRSPAPQRELIVETQPRNLEALALAAAEGTRISVAVTDNTNVALPQRIISYPVPHVEPLSFLEEPIIEAEVGEPIAALNLTDEIEVVSASEGIDAQALSEEDDAVTTHTAQEETGSAEDEVVQRPQDRLEYVTPVIGGVMEKGLRIPLIVKKEAPVSTWNWKYPFNYAQVFGDDNIAPSINLGASGYNGE